MWPNFNPENGSFYPVPGGGPAETTSLTTAYTAITYLFSTLFLVFWRSLNSVRSSGGLARPEFGVRRHTSLSGLMPAEFRARGRRAPKPERNLVVTEGKTGGGSSPEAYSAADDRDTEPSL